ncbi:MAG: AbrB/MazE/SpoVT family DNA-binding domain-containing protein [Terracidiphilus sp.]
MKCRVTFDEADRICIPESIRNELGMTPGDALALERQEDTIVLGPVADIPLLTKEHGVWVLLQWAAPARLRHG